MNENIKFKFSKTRYFKGTCYNPGDIAYMTYESAINYQNFNAGKIILDTRKTIENKIDDYSKMSYKDIQSECKKYNISAVGKKDEMISKLLEMEDSA